MKGGKHSEASQAKHSEAKQANTTQLRRISCHTQVVEARIARPQGPDLAGLQPKAGGVHQVRVGRPRQNCLEDQSRQGPEPVQQVEG